MRLVLKTGFLALLGIFSAVEAGALCLRPDERVCAAFFRSSDIFTGTVISQRNEPEPAEFYEAACFKLAVRETFKGEFRGQAEVCTHNDSGRLMLDTGKTYLLFARKSKGTAWIGEASCASNISHELAPNDKALADLRAFLRDQPNMTQANIGGRISRDRLFSYPASALSGAEVVAHGAAGDFTGVSDAGGRFSIAVPPGKYSATAQYKGQVLEAYDLSFDDPTALSLERGQCADLQFLEPNR